MGIRWNSFFAVTIMVFIMVFCVYISSADIRVAQIEITGKVMDQDGVIYRDVSLKFTIHHEDSLFEFDNYVDYKGEYALYYPIYEGSSVKISATAMSFGKGGYNEGIFRAGDRKRMDIIIIKNPCPVDVRIKGNIKNENGSFIPDAYIYLKVNIPVKNRSEIGVVANTSEIKEVIAGSTYANDRGEYVLMPSLWTISVEGADAEIFVTDKNYSPLWSEKLKIKCGSDVQKDIVIKEKTNGNLLSFVLIFFVVAGLTIFVILLKYKKKMK